VLESCDGKQTCTLESGTDIIAVDIKCPNYFESKKSAFAKIAFGCIIGKLFKVWKLKLLY